MPRKKTTPAPEPEAEEQAPAEPTTPPYYETLDQGTAEALEALTQERPDLFPDRSPDAEEEEPPEDDEAFLAWIKEHKPELVAENPELFAEDTPADAAGEGGDPNFVITTEPEEDAAAEPAPGEGDGGKARLTVHVLQKAVADEIYTAMKNNNTEVLEVLLTIWRATGAKSFEARVPTVDGTKEKVGQVSLLVPEDKVIISDEDELLDWLEVNRPDLTGQVEHPATEPVPAMPAYTETVIAPGALKTLSEEYKVTDGNLMTGDGELVPGVTYVPAPEPSQFRVSWGGAGSPDKRRAIDLLKDNAIEGTSLAGLVPLPQIGK